MFDEEDRAYFARRAAECRESEARAYDSNIGKIHRELAEEYERRARGEAPRDVIRP